MNYVDQWAIVSSVHFLCSLLAHSLASLFPSISVHFQCDRNSSRVYHLLIYNLIPYSRVYIFPFGWIWYTHNTVERIESILHASHTDEHNSLILTQTSQQHVHIHEYSLAQAFQYGFIIGHLSDRSELRNHRKCLFLCFSCEYDHSWIAAQNSLTIDDDDRLSFIASFSYLCHVWAYHAIISSDVLVGVCDWIIAWKLAAWQCLHSKKIYGCGSSHHILMITIAWKRKSERLFKQMVCVREKKLLIHSCTERPSCMFRCLFLRLWCVRRVHTPFNTLILPK